MLAVSASTWDLLLWDSDIPLLSVNKLRASLQSRVDDAGAFLTGIFTATSWVPSPLGPDLEHNLPSSPAWAALLSFLVPSSTTCHRHSAFQLHSVGPYCFPGFQSQPPNKFASSPGVESYILTDQPILFTLLYSNHLDQGPSKFSLQVPPWFFPVYTDFLIAPLAQSSHQAQDIFSKLWLNLSFWFGSQQRR